MAKYYFRQDDDMCFDLETHYDYMEENKLTEMDVFEAKIERNSDYFFCTHFYEVGEKNGTCGKMCKAYQPRNHKKGICKHHGNVYEQTDKKLTLKLEML